MHNETDGKKSKSKLLSYTKQLEEKPDFDRTWGHENNIPVVIKIYGVVQYNK